MRFSFRSLAAFARDVTHALLYREVQPEPEPLDVPADEQLISEAIEDAAMETYSDLRLDDAGNFAALMTLWMRAPCDRRSAS